MTIRKENWKKEFISFIGDVSRNDYKFSQFDCAIFPLKSFEIITGIDLFTVFVGRYKTYRGGLRVLKKSGFDSVEEWLLDHFDEIEINKAIPGDIGIYIDERGYKIGCVIAGAHAYIITNIGIYSIPITKLYKTYSIDSFKKG